MPTYDWPMFWSGGAEWAVLDYSTLVTSHSDIVEHWALGDAVGDPNTIAGSINGSSCRFRSYLDALGDAIVPNEGTSSLAPDGSQWTGLNEASHISILKGLASGWMFEGWVYISSLASANYIWNTYAATQSGPDIYVNTSGALILQCRSDNTTSITANDTIETGSIYHIAVGQRSDGTNVCFINGEAVEWSSDNASACGDLFDVVIASDANTPSGDLRSHFAWYIGNNYSQNDAQDHYEMGSEEQEGINAYWHNDTFTTDLDLTQTSKPTLRVAINGAIVNDALQSASWRLGRESWFDKAVPASANFSLVGLTDVRPGDAVVVFCETDILWAGYVDDVTSERDAGKKWFTSVTAIDVVGRLGQTELTAYVPKGKTTEQQSYEWLADALDQYGINVGLAAAYANGSSTSYTDYLDAAYTGDLIGFINRQEELGNLAVAQTRAGDLVYLTRQSSSSSALDVVSLTGDDSPSLWRERLSSTNTINRWYSEDENGDAYIDYADAVAIEEQGVRDFVFDAPTSWTDTGFGNYESSLFETVSEPRPVLDEGKFYIKSLGQEALFLNPLDTLEFNSELWSVMHVEHTVDLSGWWVSISAERSNNFINGDDEFSFDYTGPAYQTLTYDANWNREEFNYGSGWKDSGDYTIFYVGRSSGTRYRMGLEYPSISWPANTVRVVSAKAYFTYSDAIHTGGNPRVVVKPYTQDPSTNWPNVPAAVVYENEKWWNGSLLSTYDQIWVDITDIAQNWFDGTSSELGLKMTVADESKSFQNWAFFNKDADNGTTILAPYIEITVLKSS